ncbi:MAG: hypothetical protein OQJ81_10785 [Melioribacteraceae bacterium]|nr:hypothetical protein [Melioribacteraceae bacterium]
MSLYFLEKRRQIEGLYRQLELVRNKQKDLIAKDIEKLTTDNISLLELEEEYLLSKILKLKATT